MNVYQVLFPTVSIEKKFDKVLSKVPQRKVREEIMRKIEQLGSDPCPVDTGSFKRLNPPVEVNMLTAQYRLRVGDYRILYDVDHARKNVWILALRKRNEGTYRN